MPLRLQLLALRAVRSCTSCIKRLCALRPLAESKMQSHKSQGCVSTVVSRVLLCWCAVATRRETTRRVASCNVWLLMAACGSAFTVCCSSLFCSASHRFRKRLHGGVSPHLSHISALVSRDRAAHGGADLFCHCGLEELGPVRCDAHGLQTVQEN